MLYAGLDLSRTRLDFHLLDGDGASVEIGAAPPDADGLLGLTRRLDRHREPIRGAIESMNGTSSRARSARASRLAGRDRRRAWALVEAATHACTAPAYRDRNQQTKLQIGKQRGAKVAQIDLARRLSEAIWHMLSRGEGFAPKGATDPLAA
jgi:hypothetical protein